MSLELRSCGPTLTSVKMALERNVGTGWLSPGDMGRKEGGARVRPDLKAFSATLRHADFMGKAGSPAGGVWGVDMNRMGFSR